MWLARDENGTLCAGEYVLMPIEPQKDDWGAWIGGDVMLLKPSQTPIKLKPGEGPVKVKLVLDK